MKIIEIVVPCYNEEKCIRPLYDAIDGVYQNVADYEYQILYVNDGSGDGTAFELKKLKAELGERVNYISFARNFGKESAIYAGLSNSSGGVAYFEHCRVKGMQTWEIVDEVMDKVHKNDIAVLFDHPYYAGVKEIKCIEKIIQIAGDTNEVSIVPLKELNRIFRL